MPRSFANIAVILQRAMFTPGGLLAIALAFVSVLRVDRVIAIAIGDFPALTPILNPWINYCLMFVAGILIHRALQNQVRLSHVPDYTPAKALVESARKLGWNLDGAESLDILDLGNIIQQSGLDGTLAIWGREGPGQFEATYGPLIKIPQEHWREFEVYSLALLGENNAHVISKNIQRQQRGYFDLHVDREPAMWWLRNIAGKERGKRREVENRNEAMRKANRELIDQQKRQATKDTEAE